MTPNIIDYFFFSLKISKCILLGIENLIIAIKMHILKSKSKKEYLKKKMCYSFLILTCPFLWQLYLKVDNRNGSRNCQWKFKKRTEPNMSWWIKK